VYVLPYRQKGDWGSLDATNGVLVADDGTRRLPAPVRVDGPRSLVRGGLFQSALDGSCARGLGPAITRSFATSRRPHAPPAFYDPTESLDTAAIRQREELRRIKFR
jgi:hypothetical protein